MNSSERKKYEAKAKILKALAHPTRLWMIDKLSEGEKCVCEFVNSLDIDFSTISKHLSVLKEAGIAESEKHGKQVFYRLSMPCVLNFVSCVEKAVEYNVEKQVSLLD